MRVRALSALAAIAVVAVPSMLIADDGPLNPPPGPIASTPGPEPRRELNLTNTPGDADSFFKITASGSYYLAQSFAFTAGQIAGKSGIEIDADNVTVDLNGFSMTGTAAGLHGVRIVPGRQRARILNGNLTTWGRGGVTGEGSSSVHIEGLKIGSVSLSAPGAAAITVNSGSIIRDISMDTVGNAQPGIATSNNCIIERAAITTTSGGGIVAGASCEVIDSTIWALTGPGIVALPGSSVRGTSVSLCTGVGIQIGDVNSGGGAVHNCRAFNNGGGGIILGRSGVATGCIADSNTGNGIEVWFGGVITHCTARENTGTGFISRDFGIISESQAYLNGQNGIECGGGGGQVLHCTVTANGQNGIRATADNVVRNCTADNHTGGAGILIVGSDAKVEGNTCTDNIRGIDVDAPGCIIIRNVCAGNTTNFDIVANNIVGVIVSAPLSPAIVGSSGGAGVGTTNPWGNVSY